MTKIEINNNERSLDNVVGNDADNESFAGFSFPREVLPVNVAENTSGGAVTANGQGSSVQVSPAEVLKNRRAELIASKPAKEVLTSEITSNLKAELKLLKSEESKLKILGVKAISKYSEIISKIRSIHKLLASIASMGYDQLKSLWLKLVHNIV